MKRSGVNESVVIIRVEPSSVADISSIMDDIQ